MATAEFSKFAGTLSVALSQHHLSGFEIAQLEYSHKGNHLNTRPGITQPPQHPVQDASSKQQTKQKYKPSHQQTGLPPQSALPIRGKTNKQNSAQISPYKKFT